MEHRILSQLIRGLLGLGSLGALGTLGFIFSGDSAAAPPPGKPEGEWCLLEPVSYENLRIFPVVSGSSHDTSWFLTLDEGLASGEVQVREQGSEGMARSRDGVARPTYTNGASVNQLVLINRSKKPLLLLAGELVSGGKQDRVIGKDRLVPAGSEPLSLDVFCVEHGRWSAESEFCRSQNHCAPQRARTGRPQAGSGRSVERRPRRHHRKGGSARGFRFFRGVCGGATRSRQFTNFGNGSSRSTDRIVPENLRIETRWQLCGRIRLGIAKAIFTRDGGCEGRSGRRGGGRLRRRSGVERHLRVQRSAPAILEQATAQLCRRSSGAARYKQVASRSDAGEFLRQLNGRVKEETEPGVYRWREINEGRLSQIELDALEPKVMTLHRLLIHRTT